MLSVEPVIDPRQALKLIEQLSPWVDGWKVEKLNHYPLTKTVDWCSFAHDLVDTLRTTGAECLIKESLKSCLRDTDTINALPSNGQATLAF